MQNRLLSRPRRARSRGDFGTQRALQRSTLASKIASKILGRRRNQ
ncbi:hypothetical protein AKJ09_04648 [Labilithrix luteola]|uniref:Uncharacterized protein n=1 Tax=Labilithrix luteola TaxID=1391654 RepID=A0A0K1PXV8_9BACT|nr:hypothetical protein AKJ09_04648 [Labilithrix luteola]